MDDRADCVAVEGYAVGRVETDLSAAEVVDGAFIDQLVVPPALRGARRGERVPNR